MKKSARIAGLVVACGISAVRAGEGRIPVFQPTVINGSGHYVVTRDISNAGPSPIITIGGAGCAPFSGVTLDLNGHTLEQGVAWDVIRINTLCVSRGVTIRSGRIIGPASGGPGWGIVSTDDAQIDIRIEDVEIESVGGVGIDIRSAHVVNVKNCHVHKVGLGIKVDGSVGPFGGSFVGNTINSTQTGGMYLQGMSGGQIKDNVITNFGLDASQSSGIYLASQPSIGDINIGGNLVEGNSVSSLGGTNDAGIHIDGQPLYANARNMVVGNIVHGNGANGIWIYSSGNRIERNVASNNGLHGIQVGSGSFGWYNHVEGNSVQENSGCAILIANGNFHTYRNNIGLANFFRGPVCIGAGLDLGGNYDL